MTTVYTVPNFAAQICAEKYPSQRIANDHPASQYFRAYCVEVWACRGDEVELYGEVTAWPASYRIVARLVRKEQSGWLARMRRHSSIKDGRPEHAEMRWELKPDA